MTKLSIKTQKEISRLWMVGYTSEMVLKKLNLKKSTYEKYEQDMEKLVRSQLFRLAKNGYIYSLLDSIEERSDMATKLKERIDGLLEIMEKDPDDTKLMYPLHQAMATWNNIMDSRDRLLNDTPMLQSFHNFVQYNIEKGHAPEFPSEEDIPRIALAALPELIPKKK